MNTQRSNEEIRRDAAYRFGQLSAHAKLLAEENGRPWLAEQVAAAATLLAETSDRLTAALARIEDVEALHFARGRNPLGEPVCAECSPLQPMPCPTLRALAAFPTQTPPAIRPRAAAGGDGAPVGCLPPDPRPAAPERTQR